MELGISGLASGFDWKSLVEQLAEVERAPERSLQTQQAQIQQRNTAFTSVKTQLVALQAKATALKDPALFEARLAATSNATIGSAKAAAGTAMGAYNFKITQLASAATVQGTSDIGNSLSASDDVSGVVLASGGFATPITAGTFSVNGKKVEIATSDTLQVVFDKINAATGLAVTGRYDSATDSIRLSSAGTIVLGSATDTSNFLQATNLGNNGTNAVSSRENLGAARTGGTMATANLRTAISDGGGGAGEFRINGVSINYDVSKDSIASVLDRINDSSAGVTASYDTVNDRFTLTNRETGDIGFGLEDVTGNFLAATGLQAGTLERGNNLIYTVNNSGELSSRSNTIADTSSGITGLSVTVLAEGDLTLTVDSDRTAVKTAIEGFVTEYNKTQSLIATQTASTTDAKGKVTAGVLAGDSEARTLSTQLRRMVTAVVGSGTSRSSLEALGIKSNGNDDQLSTANLADLDATLLNSLSAVKELFAGTSAGIGGGLSAYLESVVGDDGTLVKHQATLTSQSAKIDTQVADLERWVVARSAQMTSAFVAMEAAQQKANNQLAFLTKTFG